MPATSTRLHHILLLILATVVFALCLWRAGTAPIIDGLPFKDSDDIMRLLQVQRWLETGAWYDLTQPRLNPPAGVDMHWSRLPDLPLATVIWLSQPLLGAEQAALLAAHLVPALLGVAFFAAFVWAARPFTGREGSVYAGLMVLALSIPGAAFAAGRIDHHGWQLLLATLGAGAVLRVLMALDTDPSPRRIAALALLAGLVGALGLWIGAEAIPPVALAAAVLGLGWLRHGHAGALALFWYGLGLTLSSLLIVPLATPQAMACDAFSWVSVGLAAAVLVFALGALLVEPRLWAARPGGSAGRRSIIRATAALFIALPLLGLLYALFPHCAGGPYAGLSPTVEQMITRIAEARSLITLLQSEPATAAQYGALPLFGLLLCLAMLLPQAMPKALPGVGSGTHAKPGPVTATLPPTAMPVSLGPVLGLTLLIAGGLLLQCWQLRGSALANLYAGLACAGWAAAVGARIRPSQSLPLRLLRRAGPVVLAGLLPTLSMLVVEQLTNAPAAAAAAAPAEPKGAAHSGTTADTAESEKTAKTAKTSCDLLAVAERLNQPDLLAHGPLLIVAPINLGAPLLWLTPHQVLAAPYHRNASGIEDAQQILFANAEEADATRALIERRDIDLLLICPHDPVATHERREGITLLYDQLRTGATPDWLIALPFDSHARLLKTSRSGLDAAR